MKVIQRLRNIWKLAGMEIYVSERGHVTLFNLYKTKGEEVFLDEKELEFAHIPERPRQAQIINMKSDVEKFLENNPTNNE